MLNKPLHAKRTRKQTLLTGGRPRAGTGRSILSLLTALVLLVADMRVLAEGTADVMPNPANGTGLYISTSTGVGPYRGAPAENRLEFVISDFNTQRLYFNFRAYNRNVTPQQIPIYYRILDVATNTVRVGPTLLATANQLADYTQAVNGPNVAGSHPGGYTNFQTFTPTLNGHFYIELYASSDLGVTPNSTNVIVTLFDFTVATTTGSRFNGRVHSKAWSFITYDPATNAGSLANALEGDFFGYTDDSTVVNLDFLPGFRPFGFTLYMNKFGAVNGTNWATDRRSQNTGALQPSLPGGYDVFLEQPDVTQFPVAAVASAPNFAGRIYGCAPTLYIPFSIDKAGDVTILLDINGTPGYQAGTRDRYLYFYNQPVGANVGVWNGLDGLGAAVSSTVTFNMSLSIRRGRVNIPMYDAELNSNGMSVSGVAPVANVPRLYFDDILLTNTASTNCSNPTTDANNNTTGGGITNADVGVTSPGRAWDGPGSGNATPAPTGTGGSTTISLNCDDYGNVRTLNTWFWAYEVSTGVFTVNVPTCSGDGDPIGYATDLDDDNDGITDVLEGNGVDAMADADLDGIPNAFDATPGPGVPAFVDTNNDGVSDAFDADLDGIVNSFDLDSDNDGIPDIIEAGGVDTDGNGRVDSNIDVNANGLMDYYDPSAGGLALLNKDTDLDGIPNSRDLDSDGDGIPDIREAGGTDADNNGMVDNLADADRDGYVDDYDPDDNNDGTNESPLQPLIITGLDTNGDRLADSYPRGDVGGDGKPNPYDLDSDGDGILDAREAGMPDSDNNGIADGALGADGWSDTVDGLAGPLVFPNTDNSGGPNYLDIDSDNDGIVDNIEAQTTAGYQAPLGLDPDNDGIDSRYDNAPLVYGGNLNNGISPTNTDLADNPDYTDTDSDNDRKPDYLEGWDTNGNGSINGGERSGGIADADNDGLLDGWDNNTAQVNPTNGQVPTDFPDVNNPGGDRDWRQAEDTDRDGIPDYIDLDDDNDGVPDIDENPTGLDPLGDSDGDGIPNYLDTSNPGFTDTNGDGIDDQYDTDLDGVINCKDLDSDNDGIPDIIEAGGIDTDGNGRVDNFTDGNGNGLADAYDPAAPGGVAHPNIDSDGDGIPNTRDLDSDNDGIPDLVEAGGVDANNDGKVDVPTDSDNDGYADAYDPDDNNDGINEDPGQPLIISGPDGNGDGRPDNYPRGDFDGDGVANPYDLDSDGDGIPDVREAGLTDSDGNGYVDGPTGADGWSDLVDAIPGPLTFTNTDGAGGPNYLDIDSDNDGIVDNIEGQSTLGYIAPAGADTDRDGIDNAYDNLPGTFGGNANNGILPVNTDGADTPDYVDLDTDNDGKPDTLEGWDTNGNGVINGAERTGGIADADNDGLLDGWDNNPAAVNPTNGTTPANYPDVNNPGGDRDWRQAANSDNDPIPDNIDLDDDNDGIPDTAESPTGLDPLGDQNGNGIPNYLDPAQPGFVDTNSNGVDDRYDTDGDGIINARDLDSDNDGIPDIIEAGGVDTNGDGRVDNTTDVNNNGLMDTYDPAAGGVSMPNRDTDLDGIPNSQDLDSDNDGIPDIIEAGGADTNNDGKADFPADVDQDGYVNTYDPDDDNNGIIESPNDPLILTGPDTNADGRPDSYVSGDFDNDDSANPYDLDSDNDGILDAREAGMPDADNNGIADGPVGADGWSDPVDSLAAPLTFPNTDGHGRPDYLDIDSDNDGIVDNIEGQSTLGYAAPAGADSDGDGIDDAYDNLPAAFGGNASNGITPVNTEGADNPDYRDLDTDNDGKSDIIEGWDTNGNGVISGTERAGGTVDTDGDGLFDGWDNDNTAVNPTNGTTPSYYPDVNNPGGDRDWRQAGDRDNDGVSNLVDLDDDNDGIPDLQESPTGLDPLGDIDSDGIPNYLDPSNPGFVDSNGDGIDDQYDTDLDGIINSWDLDNDNDGIPDIVEAGGVDANGDGRVDNFTDANGNGLNDAFDPALGGTPLGARDTDGDTVPDYYDLDSDNDGIPDVREAGGTDANNDGRIDGFVDTDVDGYSDPVDGDVGNDGIAENTANTLIPTGADTNADGRPDSYTKANHDASGLPDPYDLDSDGDGILDVREAGLTDVAGDGIIDGTIGADGWSTVVNALPTLSLPNFDNDALADYIDIDADNDGITDNVEGQSTAGYILPSGVDSDNDGIDNAYDNAASFGGNANNGIVPYRLSGLPSASPDYLNLDTDNDGQPDIVEAHDYNLNNIADDNPALTGVDSDGDGLDDAFDLVTGPNVTQEGMLAGGVIGNPATPGARGPLSKGLPIDTDRLWRFALGRLPVKLISFTARSIDGDKVQIDWKAEKEENFKEYVIERSVDGITYTEVGHVAGRGELVNDYTFIDPLNNVNGNKVYYRLKMVDLDARFEYSKVATVSFTAIRGITVQVTPNPSNGQVALRVVSGVKRMAMINIVDMQGRILVSKRASIIDGTNIIMLTGEASRLPSGTYTIMLNTGEEKLSTRMVIQK